MRPVAGRLESGVNQVHGHSLLDSSCVIIDPAAAARQLRTVKLSA
jgi:hypothetical protein